MTYRDTKTGRFVTKNTWKRGKARESKRYRREKKRRIKRSHPRFANVLISSGYDSRTEGNSYTLVVLIQRKKKETEQHISERIEHLAAKGYFDEWAESIADTIDLRFASFHNQFKVLSVTAGKKSFRATLTDFERVAPLEYQP